MPMDKVDCTFRLASLWIFYLQFHSNEGLYCKWVEGCNTCCLLFILFFSSNTKLCLAFFYGLCTQHYAHKQDSLFHRLWQRHEHYVWVYLYNNSNYFRNKKSSVLEFAVKMKLELVYHRFRSQSYQTFIFPAFRFSLLSLSVCKKGKNMYSWEMVKLIIEKRKNSSYPKKKVW